jgi:preprotein translocase subunit SecG
MSALYYYVLVPVFLLVCLFLILLVLIQKGRGGGLSGAFGGGGGGGTTAFGAKTGDVLTWATSIVFGIFLLLAIAMNLMANRMHEQRVNAFQQPATPQPTLPADGMLPPAPSAIPAPPAVPGE